MPQAPFDNEGLYRNGDLPEHEVTQAIASATGKPLRDAAVLIPLVRQQGHWHVLFIRRAHNERDRHSGQVAFPGGRRDQSDANLMATALRETEEEIGVSASQVSVLGHIDPYLTISHYRVSPVVGHLQWPVPLTLQSSEVARAFLMPLDWLRDRDNFSLHERRQIDQRSESRHPLVVYNEYDGETLWGATARMTLNFLYSLDQGQIVLPS